MATSGKFSYAAISSQGAAPGAAVAAPSSKGANDKQNISIQASDDKVVKYDELQNHKLSNNILQQKVDILRGQAMVNMNKA